jgi:hypothetical protein
MVLPTAVFFVSLRSEDTYYVVFAPIAVLAAIGTPRAALRSPGMMTLPRWLPAGLPRRLAAVLLFVPTAAFLVAGLTSPRPLRLLVDSTGQSRTGALNALVLTAHNDTGRDIRPHFLVDSRAVFGDYWQVVSGPLVLQPGETASYQLHSKRAADDGAPGAHWRLLALSDDPQTASAVAIPPPGEANGTAPVAPP